MMPRKNLLIKTVALLLGVSIARAEDASPVNAGDMLKELQSFKESQKSTLTLQRTKAMKDFLAAGSAPSTAIDFYENAVLAMQFKGQTKEGTKFREWKESMEDSLKSETTKESAQLHLNYLMLSLQYAEGKKMEDMLPHLITYARQVMDLRARQRAEEKKDREELEENPPAKKGKGQPRRKKAGRKEDLLKGSVKGSIFVQWYRIENCFDGVKGWEMSMGDPNAIFETAILPEFRKQKDPRLLEYWAGRIQRDSAVAAESELVSDAVKFERVDKPKLLWSRAQDLIILNQKNRALNEMLGIIKEYPTHPGSKAWTKELEDLLKGSLPKAAAPAPETAAVTPEE